MSMSGVCRSAPIMIRHKSGGFEATKNQKEVQGLTRDNSSGWAGNFLSMVDLRKKILSFRDIIDLPPCDTRSPIKELLMGTVGDLHNLYPKIVPSISMSDMDETSVHEVFATFYIALKSIGDSWAKNHKWLNRFTYEKEENMEEISLEHFMERVVAKLDYMIRVAKEIFDVMDEEDRKEESPRCSMFGDILSKSYSDNRTSFCLSPVTPTSVLPEMIDSSIHNGKFADYSYSPPLLWPLRLQAVGKLKPVDVKRLSFHMPNVSSPRTPSPVNQISKTVKPVEQKIQDLKRSSAALPVANSEGQKDARGKSKILKSNLNDTRSRKDEGLHNSEPVNITGGSKVSRQAPPPPLLPPSNVSAPPAPLPKQIISRKSCVTSVPQRPKSPRSACRAPPLAPPITVNASATPPPPPPVLAIKAYPAPPPPPPMVAANASAVPIQPPPVVAVKASTARSQPTVAVNVSAAPPSPPTMMLHMKSSVPPPPPPMVAVKASPTPPPPTAAVNVSAAPPPPAPMMLQTKSSIPPPPPMISSKGSVPLPPPPMPMANGAGPPPPPPLGVSKALRPKKAATKLKRSSNMGNLYRLLKGKVEGSNVDGKSSNGKKSQVGGSGGGSKQSMADALAEMTKRSAYFQQIEEDVQKHAKTIMEMKVAISSFQSKDMAELIKFHKYVESHLECLTDETQVLARFDGFPNKKLETLRMAAALHLKLDSIVTNLENWKIESPLNRVLEKVESYFNKIKGELDTLERTKDDETKRFQSQNIHFDFIILTKIKELMVDLSSGCMELALKERRQAKAAADGEPGSKADKQLKACAKMLWRAFQLAFRVYTFAGGQDDRAERLTKELAQEIETDPQN